jgi:hypothetical protein
MESPTRREKKPATSHPYTIVTGPPKASPVVYRVVTPVKIDIMENVNAKFDSTLDIAIQTHSSIPKRTSNLIIF